MSETISSLLKSTQHINRRDAEMLLAHTLHTSRESVIAHPEWQINPITRLRFFRLAKKRSVGIPLAQLTGHKAFFGLDFSVNKHTLIPRPETELLVEAVIAAIDEQRTVRDKKITLIDVGTGTGCIPISIMKTVQHKNIKTFAVDISEKTLRIAKKNAKKHNANITFLRGNLLDPILESYELLAIGSELIITANLPYLTEKQFAEEPTIQHEPKTALVADRGGLALYEELLKQVQLLFTNYYLPITCFLEIDPSQSNGIIALIHKYLPTAAVEIKKDLRGHDRLVVVDA